MNKRKLIKWLLLIIWMSIIYHFSNTPNSGDETYSLIEKILPSINNKSSIEIINYIIRKLAHLTEYFILAYLINNLLKEYTRKSNNTITILFCFLYSLTDEYHQSLVIGRTPSIKDCLIDTIGSSLFILFNYLKLKRLSKKKSISK